jgi:hypothetical protein
MSSNKGKRPRKILGYEAIYLSQRTQFDIGEYVQNPSMIKKLHEERETAHAYSNNLEKLLEDKINAETDLELRLTESIIRLEEANNINKKLEEENENLNILLKESNKQLESTQEVAHQLQIKLTRVEGKLEDVSRSSFVQFLVSVVAAALLGFGVNIVTTMPSNWVGWVLIVTSIILSIVAFTFVRKSK